LLSNVIRYALHLALTLNKPIRLKNYALILEHLNVQSLSISMLVGYISYLKS